MNEFRREFLQELDGCRPRNDDSVSGEETIVDDPQAAKLLRGRRAFDAAVADAFAQVPLPLGMAARLAAALEAEAATDEAGPLMPAATPAIAAPHTRRRWLATAGSALAATAAGGALFVWWQNRGRTDLTVEQVLEASLVFHQRAAVKRGEAKPESLAPHSEFPRSRFVTPHAEPRVRPLDEPLLGRTGVVYELAPAGEPRASLYVMSERPGLSAPAVPLLPSAPMTHPFKTGGCAMSAWREAHRIVLLVVDGDERRYREYLAAPQEFA